MAEKTNSTVLVHVQGKNGARTVELPFHIRTGETIGKVVVTKNRIVTENLFDSSWKDQAANVGLRVVPSDG
jgi:hypothetical protein